MKSFTSMLFEYKEDKGILYVNCLANKSKLSKIENIIDKRKPDPITIVRKEIKQRLESKSFEDKRKLSILNLSSKKYNLIYRFEGEKNKIKEFEKTLKQIIKEQDFLVVSSEIQPTSHLESLFSEK